MTVVNRSYDQPDQFRTVWSTEEVTWGLPAASFPHTELARRQRGFYHGVKTPGWKKRLASGDIVPLQPYTRYDEFSSQSGRHVLQWDLGGGRIRTATIASCGIFEEFPQTLPSFNYLQGFAERYARQAEGLLQDAASDIADNLDVLTFLAEIRQVKSLFLSLGPKLIAQLLKMPPDKAAASVWLQWQFGWKPLYNDLKSISKIITSPKGASRRTKTKSKSFSVETLIDLQNRLGNGETHYVTGTDSTSVNIRATVIADISAFTNNAYINPISTAWELTPWSFIVDYFFNIGNWIKANSLVLAGMNYTASIGYDVQLKRTLNLSGQKGLYLYGYSASGAASVDARLKMRVPRTISLGNIPPVNEETLSVTRLINLVSLALQKLR